MKMNTRSEMISNCLFNLKQIIACSSDKTEPVNNPNKVIISSTLKVCKLVKYNNQIQPLRK